MPQRFGQASDYGAAFTFLATQNDQLLRSRALAFDRQREEEQASRDSLMFERYSSGDISGDEILAYIRQRIRETAYDKAQQNKWREALAKYTDAVSDQKAEDAYAETGDIHALISHYANRLSGSRKGTPERTDLARRLRDLRTQRDADNLQRGAKRIARQIKRGEKGTKDLIAFYKDQLQRLPRGDLRQKVMDALADARATRREELMQSALSRVDIEYTKGMSPQQAADRKEAILKRFDLKGRDPQRYWQMMSGITALRGTPDPAKLAELQTRFDAGDITLNEYQEAIYKYADKLQPYNQSEAWKLRDFAIAGIEGATPLPNPEAIGGNASKIVAHISQLDGSKYSLLNCTMAAAAMLAYTMGTKDLSGGDIRWATGDTAGGTTLGQAKDAMRQLGVKGKLRNQTFTSFDKFKELVGSGAPAVLSGWNGDIDSSLNSSGIIGGHAMFVVGYDKKRNAFLMLDPAKSSDKGTWWPASEVRKFGWKAGPNDSGLRNGSVLFGPTGTIDPTSLRHWKGARTVHISVDKYPQRPETPRNWVGQFNPGLDDANTAVRQRVNAEKRKKREAAKVQTRKDRLFQKQLREAGLEGTDIQTEEQALARIDDTTKTITDISHYLDAWEQLQRESGGQEDTFEVTVGADSRVYSIEDIRALQEDALHQLLMQELLYDALDQPKKADTVRNVKAAIVSQGVRIGTLDHKAAQRKIFQDASRAMQGAEIASDPGVAADILERVVKAIEDMHPPSGPQEVADVTQPPDLQTETGAQVEQATSGLSQKEQTSDVGLLQIAEGISDPEMSTDDLNSLFEAWALQNGEFLPDGWPDTALDPTYQVPIDKEGTDGAILAGLVSFANRFHEVGRGEAAWVVRSSVTPDGKIVGALDTLPVVPDPGVSVGGQRSTTSAPETRQVEGLGGVQGDTLLGPGFMLDISNDPFSQGLPYSHSDQLPRAGIRIDGIETPIHVIPVRTDYPGMKFLRIADDAVSDMLERYNVRGTGGEHYLIRDEVDKLQNEAPGLIDQLIAAGALKSEPFRVMAIGLPPYVDSNGKKQKGSTWFQNPEDPTKWSKDGLPFVSGTKDDETGIWTAFGGGYVGVDPDRSSFGRPLPYLELEPDVLDNATVGVTAPYNGNVSLSNMEKWRRQGLLGPDSGMEFDAEGNIVPRDPNEAMYFKQQTVADAIRTQVQRAVDATNKAKAEADYQASFSYTPLKDLLAPQNTPADDVSKNIDDTIKAFGVERSSQSQGFEPPKPEVPAREPKGNEIQKAKDHVFSDRLPKISTKPPKVDLPKPRGPDKAPEVRNRQYDPLKSISPPTPKSSKPKGPDKAPEIRNRLYDPLKF